MRPNPQFPADLVTLTEEVVYGKLHFLCSAEPTYQRASNTKKIKCNLINCHCDVTLRFIYRQYVSYALFRFRSKFYTSIVFSWRVIINFALWLLEIAKSKNKQKQKRLDFDCLETVDVINNLSFN